MAGTPDHAALSDGELLERFVRGHDEAAFAALVRRHGPMVLGVCRRILRDDHTAEDAFQATFLVLFRRARSLDQRGSLAGYLDTVAYRAAHACAGVPARLVEETVATTLLGAAGQAPAPIAALADGVLRAMLIYKVKVAMSVVLLVFSKFGRRLAENGSGGTDHGTAAPVFLLGEAVQPGLHSPYPNLRELDDGDPRHAIDFRRIYATLLDAWLGCPAEKVLGGKFEPVPVLAAR
jgi:hypothetical protein